MAGWIVEKKHLPPLLRDFSFQGWLFRWIDHTVQANKRAHPTDLMLQQLPDSIAAHVYVIDYFLQFMAIFGYTLQRTNRRGIEVIDLKTTIDSFEKEQRQALLNALFSSEKEHSHK